MVLIEGIRCPAYGHAEEGQIPVCRQTGISGSGMRDACPQELKESTDGECIIIPEKARFIPVEFLSKWREILEQRLKDEQKRIY